MKKYKKPTIVKVELNHEQAVLGTCSSSATTTSNSSTAGCSSSAKLNCSKSSNTAPGQRDNAATS